MPAARASGVYVALTCLTTRGGVTPLGGSSRVEPAAVGRTATDTASSPPIRAALGLCSMLRCLPGVVIFSPKIMRLVGIIRLLALIGVGLIGPTATSG